MSSVSNATLTSRGTKKLKNLKDYLHYRIALKEYEAKIVATTGCFENFCQNHV